MAFSLAVANLMFDKFNRSERNVAGFQSNLKKLKNTEHLQ